MDSSVSVVLIAWLSIATCLGCFTFSKPSPPPISRPPPPPIAPPLPSVLGCGFEPLPWEVDSGHVITIMHNMRPTNKMIPLNGPRPQDSCNWSFKKHNSNPPCDLVFSCDFLDLGEDDQKCAADLDIWDGDTHVKWCGRSKEAHYRSKGGDFTMTVELSGRLSAARIQCYVRCVDPVVMEPLEPLDSAVDSCHCGMPLNSRIVGGVASTPNAIPWQVAILTASGNRLLCGATLVSPNYVVSAAHCFDEIQFSEVLLHFGRHNITAGQEIGMQIRSVRNGHIHPNYNSQSFDNDLSILELQSEVDLSSNIYPACLPQPLLNDESRLALISGWGSRSEQLLDLPDVLHEANVFTQPQGVCGDISPNLITPNMICADGDMGEDSCQGDSGGPLVYLDDDFSYTLIGVTSWGIGCGNTGVYTRVTAVSQWIDSIIDVRCSKTLKQ